MLPNAINVSVNGSWWWYRPVLNWLWHISAYQTEHSKYTVGEAINVWQNWPILIKKSLIVKHLNITVATSQSFYLLIQTFVSKEFNVAGKSQIWVEYPWYRHFVTLSRRTSLVFSTRAVLSVTRPIETCFQFGLWAVSRVSTPPAHLLGIWEALRDNLWSVYLTFVV